jgi:hypothetical protein
MIARPDRVYPSERAWTRQISLTSYGKAAYELIRTREELEIMHALNGGTVANDKIQTLINKYGRDRVWRVAEELKEPPPGQPSHPPNASWTGPS